MDPVRNPFAPGAGTQPPELAGRQHILDDARTALCRALIGRTARSQILLGLRGVGKTVLLNRIEELAEEAGLLTSYIEAPEEKTLAQLLYPKMHKVLRQLSAIESAKSAVHDALRALRSFASVFKISVGEYSIEVDPEAGVADSGDLEIDIPDLFLKIGSAARAAGKGWALLVDEVQYLKKDELSAIIVGIHRSNQKQLPIIFFGAGLPQIAGISGDAKSYAERLFSYPAIGQLDANAARQAIEQPVLEEGEAIDDGAITFIIHETDGYPYFLQEWGFQSWEIAHQSPISVSDVQQASKRAIERLDEGFFNVRFDRLTNAEREYVVAMASLGKGPYKSAKVAETLQKESSALGPRRAQIISKGMIYSPSYGDIEFTVPMFDEFLRRKFKL